MYFSFEKDADTIRREIENSIISMKLLNVKKLSDFDLIYSYKALIMWRKFIGRQIKVLTEKDDNLKDADLSLEFIKIEDDNISDYADEMISTITYADFKKMTINEALESKEEVMDLLNCLKSELKKRKLIDND